MTEEPGLIEVLIPLCYQQSKVLKEQKVLLALQGKHGWFPEAFLEDVLM